VVWPEALWGTIAGVHGIVLYLVTCVIFAVSIGILVAIFSGVYFVARRLKLPLRILIAACVTIAIYVAFGNVLMNMLGDFYHRTHY
jgi:hypothetical protein